MTVEEALAVLVKALKQRCLQERLNDVQELVFCQCWEGRTYQEIAESAGYDVNYIKVVGSKLWKLLSEASGEKVTKSNFRSALKHQAQCLSLGPQGNERLAALTLEQPRPMSGYSRSPEMRGQEDTETEKYGDRKNVDISISQVPFFASSEANANSEEAKTTIDKRQDWSEAVDVSAFYGRTEELAVLEQWIIKDRCRLVALLGMGGIGKTALAAKVAEQTKDEFEYLIWRSLRNAPSIKDTLAELIYFLSNEGEKPLGQRRSASTTVREMFETDLPETIDGRISRLVDYLREHRCLLILDNAEVILRSGDHAGRYREGYEGYGQLLRWVGETRHQSCMLLTSREKPTGIASKEGSKLPIRSLQLTGLQQVDAQEVISAKDSIYGSESEWIALVEYYAGNPLALKIVSTTIRELFNSSISKFLKQGTVVYGDICNLLDQQFNRLSDLEKQVVYWLKINREWASLSELLEDMVPPVPQRKLLEALESLQQRSLIEKNGAIFILQPFVMEYMVERLDRTMHEKEHNKHDYSRLSKLIG